ncbi:hypothetical protein Tco_0490728 [Tanacetum coccineum]
MEPKRSNMSEDDINKLVAQSMTDALAVYEVNRNSGNGNGNGNDNGSHDSWGGGGRTPHTTRECTYSEFLKCQPLNFKGTQGDVGLAVRIIKKTRSPCVMSNIAAGSDTRPPMLDRTDYESWSQRIQLYCRGKENGVYILQSIDQGPFQLGVTRDTLGTTPEGGALLGPERARTYDDLNDNEKKRFDADVLATNIVLQGLPKDIYKLINHNIEAKAIWDNVKMLLAGSELTKEDRES